MAKLTFALRPSMMGLGSLHALSAAGLSPIITCIQIEFILWLIKTKLRICIFLCILYKLLCHSNIESKLLYFLFNAFWKEKLIVNYSLKYKTIGQILRYAFVTNIKKQQIVFERYRQVSRLPKDAVNINLNKDQQDLPPQIL